MTIPDIKQFPIRVKLNSKYTTADILLIVSEIAPALKPHITETNVAQFVDGLKRK
jgi:hypothetical protein